MSLASLIFFALPCISDASQCTTELKTPVWFSSRKMNIMTFHVRIDHAAGHAMNWRALRGMGYESEYWDVCGNFSPVPCGSRTVYQDAIVFESEHDWLAFKQSSMDES